MAEPMVHHRGADFQAIYTRALSRLQDVYRTRSPVLLFSASGTGAMDSAVTNLTAAGDRVAVVVAGAFGERWVKICDHYGLDVQRIDYAWGEAPDPGEVAAAVAESGARSSSARTPRPRPAWSPTSRGSRPRSATPCSRRRRLVARRRAARDRRVGHRRRRCRLTEGAHVPARPRDRRRRRRALGHAAGVAQLLLRLARRPGRHRRSSTLRSRRRCR